MPNETVRKRRQSRIADAKPPEAWVDRECEFKDERLDKRFRSLLDQLSSSPGDSIPLVCQDWANTKAAYRFLDNDRVSEAQILDGHFQATRDRAATIDGAVLVMHDTTEFTYTREDIDAVGKTRINVAGGRADRRPRYYTGCGILMHSSLAVTTALEIQILHRLAPDSQPGSSRSSTLQSCLTKLACLGGYLNRAKDPPPGNMVIWRGMSRPTDIEIGFLMATANVGN
jgi:hypothetical protein